MNEYEGVRRVSYDFGGDIGQAVFVPVCQKCGRFIKAPAPLITSARNLQRRESEPYAECSRCGPTVMPFEGFM